MARNAKKETEETIDEKEKYTGSPECPVREVMDFLEHSFCESFGVFRQTRIEFLKAVRTIIDRQIESLESKKSSKNRQGRVRKIVVED